MTPIDLAIAVNERLAEIRADYRSIERDLLNVLKLHGDGKPVEAAEAMHAALDREFEITGDCEIGSKVARALWGDDWDDIDEELTPIGQPEAGNTCEHGDHSAPAGRRFCSDTCARCEHESESEATGCDGICRRVD